MLAHSEMLTGMLGLSGAAMVTLALMMMLRKRKQRQAEQPTAREQLERLKQKQAMRGDLEHLMVELEQLTRRFSAQLDAKSLQLEKLIDQADRRIDELKRLQGESPGESGYPGESSRFSESPEGSHTFNADESPELTSHSSSVSGDDALVRQVYALADSGHDASAIAQQLNEHIGKIELMLALRNTQDGGESSRPEPGQAKPPPPI